jgi:ectoine hydroxylase-related dioxygenase (phytanoyl-CoA dioxygenase family)
LEKRERRLENPRVLGSGLEMGEMMGALTGSQKAEFDSQGYVILPRLVAEKAVGDLMSAIAKTFRKHEPAESLKGSSPWKADDFHRRMIRFRQEKPEWFGALYDTIQTSSALYSLIHTAAMQSAAAELLSQSPEDLCATGHMVRMDPPHDTRNVLKWHQESFYYSQNISGKHGLVCWIPLQDVGKEHGNVWFCPGSHRAGRLETESLGKKDYISSEQFTVSQETIDKYKPVQITAKAGDVVFFHMDLLHRSGENVSGRIRFTAGVRFHCMLKDDFLPGRLIYKPNEMVEKHRAAKLNGGAS